MKFTVPVQTIIDPVTRVANICTANPSNPDDLSQFVLFEVTKDNITLTGTDNAVQIKAVIPLPENACEREGTFLMLASRAREFFKSLGSDDDVVLELQNDDEMLHATSDRASFNIRVRTLNDDKGFPTFKLEDEAEPPKSFRVEEHKLRYMIEKSVFCVSRENFREYLKGMRFDIRGNELYLFALDGHRMAALDTVLAEPVDGEILFSLTLRGVTELQKLLSNEPNHIISISVSENFATTKVGIYELSNRLIHCKYPNVRGVLPNKCEASIPVDLAQLKTYVKRVSLFSNKRLNVINFVFDNNNVAIHSQNSEHEVARANIAIDYQEGKQREVNLNADLVKEFLNSLEAPMVIFGFAHPYTNTLLTPNVEDENLGVRIRYVISQIMV